MEQATTSKVVSVTRESNGVALIHLNRPPANSYDRGLIDDLNAAVDEIRFDESIGAAVLMGQRGHPRRDVTVMYATWTLATLAIAGYGIATAAWQLMLACLVAVYTAVLWSRDGRLPVFEVGTLLVAATFVYSAVPLLGFIAMGHQWAPWVDNRLLAYPFDAYEIALFGWRDALYLGTFIGVYLLVRRSVSARSAPLEPVPAPLIAAIVIVVAVLYAYKIAIMVGYGIDFGTPYSSTAELVARVAQMPLVLLQITVIVLAAFLVVKEALLLVMIRKWRSLKWRFILVAVLIVEVIAVAVRMGGRAEAVLLLLAFAALYDRFVRPVRLKWITIGGVLLIAGFLIQGHLRGLFTLRELTISNALTTSNEFQSLFTTSYDLYQRKHLGVLGPVPWQIYASDFYLLVPQQLLPFAKIDPAEWYLDVLGIRA